MDTRDRNFSDFNKEILYGEAGAILGAGIVSLIASHFSSSRVVIAQFAVIGSATGASILFLLKKIRNKIRRGDPILRGIINDLKYFTPAAAVIGFGIGYPVLYYLTKYLVKAGWETFAAGAVSEMAAFSIFICLINIYRFGLIKFFRKNIA